MPYDRSSAADVELIILTGDPTHADALRDSFGRGAYRYAFTHLSQRPALLSDFESAIEAVRGVRPVVVIFDCQFLGGQAEMFAARVLQLRNAMAIECVATRPPSEHHRRACLKMLGASLFEESQTAEIIRLN